MSAERHNARGHERLARGDVDGAMAAFLDALAEDPGDVPAMLSRLEILALYREDHAAAIAAGRVMRAHGVGGVVLASSLSYSLQSLGMHREALEVIYEGLRTAPETETLWYNAACSHAKLRLWTAAIHALEAATGLDPSDGATARADEDFAAIATEPWFLAATDPSTVPVRAPASVLIAHTAEQAPRAAPLAEALRASGYAVEARVVERPLDPGALDGAPRALLFDDRDEAARAVERELARVKTTCPVALVVPTWLPTEHLPSFHAPDDRWGPGALGLLRFFLGPLACEPPGPALEK